MVHPDLVDTFMNGVEEILRIAPRLGCRNLGLLAGEIEVGTEKMPARYPVSLDPITTWVTAYKTVCQVAELAEKHDVSYYIEALNTKVDHPGYPLSRVEDALRLIEQVGSPRIKLILDIYHVQVEEGNVAEIIRSCGDAIGHVHVADVPGRHEPGTGEINYPFIVKTLRDVGYHGVVGLEAFPVADTGTAIERFRELFTV